MRGVVKVGSVEKTLSLGMVRRLRFEDAIEDGYLLPLTPGRLEEVPQGQYFPRTLPWNQPPSEITDSMSVSVSAHDPT